MPEFFKRPTLLSAWVAVAVWVLAYGLLKVFSPDGLDIDSAEQVYFAQSWQLGYGTRQPPLYTWLLLLLKPASASWMLALEVGRYLCLLIWLGGVQALARACGANRSVQARVVLAHLGLLLAMWRVHDSLTHTVLAAGVTMWASVAVTRALARPAWWPVVGLLAAVACLSKLNAALWCLSSLAAAWIVILKPTQGAPASPARTPASTHLLWMLLALLVFCLAIAPYAHWWLTQPSGSVALARRVVLSDAHLPWWKPMLRVVLGCLEFLLLTPLLLALLAWRVRGSSPALSGPDGQMAGDVGRWLSWQTGCGLTILLVLMMVMQASHFTPRWLWPVIPGTTVLMCVKAWQVLDRDGLSVWRARAVTVTWALVVLAIAAAVVRWWVPQQNAQRCKSCWTDRPAEQVSADLHQRYGQQPLRVITGDDHLAGILAQVDERDSTWTSNSVDLPPPADFVRDHGTCVAAWITMDHIQSMPDSLRGLVGDAANGVPVAQTMLPMQRAPQRTMWLHSMPLPASVCNKARQ